MQDFVNWCSEKELIDISNNGHVTWKEDVRDARKDLSTDYVDYCHKMGTVWPFKVVAKKGESVSKEK
jgi:hypothetical protein